MDEYAVIKGLSEGEMSKLAECEGIIRRGMKTFVEVGKALLTIRDQRLYREQFKTFDAYCREQWGFSKVHATRLVQAAQVVENLVPIGTKPDNEAQVRPLTKLKDTDQQREAWRGANENAEKEGREVTAKDVEDAVETMETLSRKGRGAKTPFEAKMEIDDRKLTGDSFNLQQLKHFWKRANRADKKAFSRWIGEKA
jgi:hypothetical protein